RAILGVVVGEFFGSSEGLGFVMAAAAGNYQVDILFAGLILFMSMSLIMTMGVKSLESRLSSWRPEQVKTF
ncbi:MAG: ABC transporter permease, partial [Candidatus Binatia bacterium]